MTHLKQTLFGVFTLAAFASAIALMPAPAAAGFQFSPAPKAGTAAAALPGNGPLMPMVAPDEVERAPLSPTPAPPLPALPPNPLASGERALAPIETPSPVVKAASTLPDAVGFGSDLPLVLGMRQIVPPQYAYAFDPGIDQGAKMSWQGGKPWDLALNDALKPLGYTARVDGTTVQISITPPAPAAKAAPIPSPVAKAPPVPVTPPEAKPVREVYVHRNAPGLEIEERTPGKPETLSTKNDVVLRADESGTEKSLWDRVNPVNWNKGGETAPIPPADEAAAPDDVGAAPASVLNNSAVMKWEAKEGDSLKTVLQQWSERAKVQLYWVPAQDYKLPAPVNMTGSYTDAVADVLGAYGNKGARPVGRLHPNLPDGPSVLIIEPASS